MIGFAGLSHLGIVYSLATASRGLEVLGFDPDAALCAELGKGRFPVSEPGLEDLFRSHGAQIQFSADPASLRQCEVVFYSLDVSTDDSNRSNLDPLRDLIERTALHLAPTATAVILSQVPPGFTRSLRTSLADRRIQFGRELFYQVETLVFGNAVQRALQPERFIVGGENPMQPTPGPYANWLKAFGCPVLSMRYESAELAKIAINLFLVSTVTTTNTLAEICERLGADWSEIAPALRLDKRIGPHAYLAPGLGIAGGNLERDLVTVQGLSAQYGTEAGVVSAWQTNSSYRRDWALRKVHELVLSRIADPALAIWGLAYKAGTHSIRNSPALGLLDALSPFKAAAYDPQVKSVPGNRARLRLAATALDACNGADALVVLTPWSEFSKVSPSEIKAALRHNVVIDPFGVLDAEACTATGLSAHRLGRRSETI